MGLDAVEIIMSCEDAFGIAIRDADAEKVRTAGDLHALIMRLLGEGKGASVCPSSRVFYELRKKLMGIGMPRRMIRPQTRLLEIVQELGNDRGQEIRTALQIPISIGKPRWAEVLVFGGIIVAGIAARFMWKEGALWVGIGAGIVAGYLLYLVTMPVRFELAMNQSMREITYSTLARRRRERSGPRAFSEAETWEMIRGILAEHLGIPMEEIKRESRLFEDLGSG